MTDSVVEPTALARPRLLAGEPQAGESSAAILACNDFLRLGPARKVRALARKYQEAASNAAPTHSYHTLRNWSEKYGWPQRAAALDAVADERASADYQAVLEGASL